MALPLVGQRFVGDYYERIRWQIPHQVSHQSDEYMVGVDADKFATYIYNMHALPTIELDPSRERRIEQKNEWVTRDSPRGGIASYERVYCRIEYPLLPKDRLKEALFLSASNWLVQTNSAFDDRTQCVIFETDPSEQDVRNAIAIFESNMRTLNAEISQHNAGLKSCIRDAVTARKEEIVSRRVQFDELVRRIDIPLVQKPLDATPIIDLAVKREVSVLVPPEPERREEYFLDKAKVLAVVAIIEKIGRGFEVTPAVFVKLAEPDLRSIILGLLNAVFVVYVGGSATAETFSKRGKTDIHLHLPKGDILIAECKFWDGNEEYCRTIDQLFRYLTWRHNYGIVITFSRNAAFTTVLSNIGQATTSHPSFKGGFERIGTSHFESIHRFPDDVQKEVEIHHLAFSLFDPTSDDSKTPQGKPRRDKRESAKDAK